MDPKARWPRGRVALLVLALAVLVALAALRRVDLPAFSVAGPEADVPAAVVREPVVARPMTGPDAAPPVPACEGHLAFRSGDYRRAYGALVVQSADDPSAAFLLGRMFAEGLAVPANPAAATRAFQSAAERGHRDAAYALALQYRGGPDADFTQALHWFEQAALLGDAAAQQQLVEMYASGTGVVADPLRAAAWLEVVQAGHLAAGTALPAALAERRRQLAATNNNNAIAAAFAELQGRIAVARAAHPGESPCES